MKVIDIYDVVSGDWYKQEIVGGFGVFICGCVVVVVFFDYLSYNIYYYGGFDGINNVDFFSDEVWVFFMLFFIWYWINEGKEIYV